MKKLRCLLVFLFCFIFFIAGCSNSESQSASTQLPGGGGQSPAASASGGQQASGQEQSGSQMIEPKQLISKEEAAQLIGEAVKDGSVDEQQMLGMKICFYPAENSSSKSYLSIAVIQQGSLQQGESSGGGQSGGSSGSQSGGQSGGNEQSGSQSGGSSGGGGGSQSGENQLTPKGIFEAIKTAMEDLNAADTGRIGDDNFMSAQGMAIISGEYFIYVTAGNNDPALLPQIIKQAGEMAVRNLKRIQGK